MAWSYSGDPSTSKKDEVRFLIGDTNINQQILSDEEIEYMLKLYPEKNMLLAKLFEKLADVYGVRIKRSLGPESEDPTSRTDYFKDKANHYMKLAVSMLGLPILTRTKGSELSFKKGMDDNVRVSKRIL